MSSSYETWEESATQDKRKAAEPCWRPLTIYLEMQSHRPPFTRCATNAGTGFSRCSWGLLSIGRGLCQETPGHRMPLSAATGGLSDAENSLKIHPRTGGSTSGTRRCAMAVQGLGYAGFGSDALDDWRQFGTGLLGLQAVERGNN